MSKLKSKGNFTEYLYYITSTWEVRLRHGDALRPCDSREGSRFSLSQPATVLPVTDFGLDKRMMALVDFCCRKLRPDYPVGAFSFVAPASSRLFSFAPPAVRGESRAGQAPPLPNCASR